MRKINYDKYSEVYENEDYFVGRYKSTGQFRITSKIYEQTDTVSTHFEMLPILTTIENNYEQQLPSIIDELMSEYYEQMVHKDDYRIDGMWVNISTTYSNEEYQIRLRIAGHKDLGVGSYKHKKNVVDTEEWLHECLSQHISQPIILERARSPKNNVNPLEKVFTIKQIGIKQFREKYDPAPINRNPIIREPKTMFRTSKKGGLLHKGHMYPISVTDYLKAIRIFKKYPNPDDWANIINKACVKNELTLNDWINIYEAYHTKELNHTFKFFETVFRRDGYIQGHRFSDDCVKEYEISDYWKE